MCACKSEEGGRKDREGEGGRVQQEKEKGILIQYMHTI
jgi:hypothetical protein